MKKTTIQWFKDLSTEEQNDIRERFNLGKPTPSPEVIEELKEIRRKFTRDTLPDGSTSNIIGTWSYDNEDMGRAINAIIRYLCAHNAGKGK